MLTDSQGNILGGSKTLGNNIYEYDGYTGNQVTIMFGDILIDTVTSISFQGSQSKTPIYGFNSQYYSFMADGHILIQGNLTIGFKESGYLFYPIQKLINNSSKIYSAEESTFKSYYSEYSNSPRYSVSSDGTIINSYNPKEFTLTEASRAAKNKKVMRGNVEQMFGASDQEDPQKRRVFSDFWNELGALEDNEFEDWAEVFEDALWYGSERNNPFVRDKLFSKNIKEGTEITEEMVLSHRRADQYPEFDIWIIYGDMSRQPSNHTVRKLLDVSFVGQSQVIEVDENVYEQYSFIARNIV